jgi:hypothetical protein
LVGCLEKPILPSHLKSLMEALDWLIIVLILEKVFYPGLSSSLCFPPNPSYHSFISF